MAKANLRPVGPDEKAPKGKPKTILEAVEAGDRLAELELTHVRIAKAVQDDATPARDLASLSRRQMEISKEIESLRRQRDEEATDVSDRADEEFDAEAI